ncbi:MAG: Wzz/FepE/Etk N-terminal domain-containing protein [Tannerellaceae bacterium]|nr:Wzz/FepE/Etk N-terminal domain-containing protein [Tannerellaceae bacterium]
MEDKIQNTTGEDEIDLIELLKKILQDWKLILKACGIAVLIALVVAFSLPKEYKTEVQLAPEATDASSKGGLSGLAAIAGINLNTSTTADAFSPDLYPDIVKSTPFILELLPVRVKAIHENTEWSLYEYMDEHQKSVWWNSVIRAPFTLLGWIRGLFSEQPETNEINQKGDIVILNRDQQDVIKALQERISVAVDKKTYVITIAVQMQDPLISAQITQMVLEKLQNYIITYRTQKAKQDLEFTEKVYNEAKDKYFERQREYASFEDSNRHINTALYRTEQEKLKNEMTLAYNVYNSLAQKLEQDRLRVQEQTPVFAIIEPAKVPLLPSSPRKIFILIGFVFLAGILAVGYILFKEPLGNIYDEVKQK